MHYLIVRFVRVFEKNPKWRWRVLAAGGFGLTIALLAVITHPADFGVAGGVAAIVSLTGFFLLAGCLLATMDYVQSQIEAGKKVGLMTRLLFGMNLISVWIWALAIFLVSSPLAAWLGSLTWKKH